MAAGLLVCGRISVHPLLRAHGLGRPLTLASWSAPGAASRTTARACRVTFRGSVPRRCAPPRLPLRMRPEELGLHPDRASDRALLDAVRPADWQNPRPRPRYHLVVVGGGTAGLVTAAGAAALGATVALVERRLLGGDCLNVGCVPSKAVIRAARAWHQGSAAAADFGAPPHAGGSDMRVAMERMRRIRAGIAPHDSAERFSALGVHVFLGDGGGRFVSPSALEVDGVRLSFRRAVIASGTRPLIPAVRGLAEAGFLTNETVFGLDDAPARLAVLGGGPIGCELAQAFARLGSRVTIVEQTDRVLREDDPDAAAVVVDALRRDGVELLLGTELAAVRREGSLRHMTIRRNGRTWDLTVDELLVAAGRAPNVESLGLDAAGVRTTREGIVVDGRLRTDNARIYAIGDVVGSQRYTHLADAHARLVVANALFFGRGKAGKLIVPRCTYTDPELAHVGVTPAQAAARGVALDTIEIPLQTVDRARLDGDSEGLLRVHLAPGTDRILGATLVAARAGEMIAEMALAMTAGLGLSAIGRTIHPYPTQAEVFRKAADAWRRRKLTPAARKVLGWYFRWLR